MFYNFWFECLLGCVCVLKQVNVKVFLCFEKHLPSQKIIKKIIKEEPKKKEKPKRKENKKVEIGKPTKMALRKFCGSCWFCFINKIKQNSYRDNK